MIARQAEWNCSIFRKEGKLPLYDVIRAYLTYVSLVSNRVRAFFHMIVIINGIYFNIITPRVITVHFTTNQCMLYYLIRPITEQIQSPEVVSRKPRVMVAVLEDAVVNTLVTLS